jgi:chromatin segregation and condensation protein Rec8/ScpA/Scc1 (kleisin family)
MEYEDLYKLILDDELGWEHLISSIVREEGMDPMDIDLIKITDRFLAVIANNSIDFRYGGRFVHTAAILLKMQSEKVADDILNRKLQKEMGSGESRYIKAIPFDILVTPKLPLIRNRKITFTELISAIREALKYTTKPKINFKLELKEIKIQERISFLIEKLIKIFGAKEVITFSELLTKRDRKEVVYTLLPLLFLSNMERVDLSQETPFGEIYVKNKRIR